MMKNHWLEILQGTELSFKRIDIMAKKTSTRQENYNDPPQTLSEHLFYGFKLDADQTYFRDCIWNPEKKIIFCNAKAGTGKTQMAFATANLLVEHGFYDGIVYIVSPYGEAKQGFLPGDITEKSEVYFEPIYQAMIKCDKQPEQLVYDEAMIAKKNGAGCGYVKCLTHTYLRGTNFERQVVIMDESQNFSFADMKKTITRVNDDCKLIVIGHELQKDTDDETNAFIQYLNYYKAMEDAGESRVAVCKLTKNYRGWISQTADDLMCNPRFTTKPPVYPYNPVPQSPSIPLPYYPFPSPYYKVEVGDRPDLEPRVTCSTESIKQQLDV